IHKGEFLHQKGFTGTGMTIAIIDGGSYHYKTTAAFDSVRANNRFLGERDFVDFDGSVNEDADHGELCLSTIASNVPGVMVGTAPNASFWLLRGENVNSEYPIEEHNWVAAAEFADSAGADLISSSLGYFTFDDAQFNHTYADIYQKTTTVSKGAGYAAKKGMIVTNSAGNEGAGSWKYIIFPADADSVCSVGAVSTSGAIAGFSSYGYPGKVKPNIVSVGSGTTLYGSNGLTAGSGTSFSNPNINGLIACLWQAFPKFNNMTILNAVYQSANKYNAPDNRFGYGIPDMKKAFRILKAAQNLQLYGTEWLLVKQPGFTDKVNITLIGQVDGDAQLNLVNSSGKIVAAKKITTEIQEVYNTTFDTLQNIPEGTYTVQYKDNSVSKRVSIVKKGVDEVNGWLHASPVPFKESITASLTAPESGKASVQLIDVRGKIWESHEVNVTKNKLYTVNFLKAASVPAGLYFIQYKGATENKTITVQKQ
ncbi:MAG TPA: S8 family serine peptidase, partial [Panacibacter sp.]|nr:S8 family serine peptidase [Panacibacter sp.]